MSSGSVNAEYINVFLRVRASTFTKYNAKNSITVVNKKRILIPSNQNKEYEFEQIFDSSSTQADVFDTACIPLVKELFNGYDCTVLMYGQSGTGKTYTLLGPNDSDEVTLGIIQRSFAYIFNNISHFKKKAVVCVSCLGLVGDELIDFLSDNCKADAKENIIKIYENQLRSLVSVEGLKEVRVFNIGDVDNIIKQTLIKKQKIANAHMIFSIVIRVREANFNGEEVIKTGKLSFADLSFSDSSNSKDSNSMSVFTLRNVIAAVSEKQSHIPYRNSKLTRLLQGSINGPGKTTMIATISTSKNLKGTLSTLTFASKMKLIQNYPRTYQIIPGNMFINQYTDEIHRLKKNIEASQTNVGINICEENYNSMLMETNSLKKELFEKTVLNRDTEEEVENSKREAIRIENILNKMVKEIESLISKTQILSTNYKAALQEKDEKEWQLQQIKCNHNQLIANTEMLMGEVQTCTNIEREMQKKMDSLYECFQKCKAALREFRPLFDVGNLRIISDIEKCITSSKELLENNFHKIQSLNSELDKTCANVKHEIEELNMLCVVMFDYVDNYKRTKNSYPVTKADFTEQLKYIENCLNLPLFEPVNMNLYQLDKQVNLMKDSWIEMCTTLVNSVKDIDFMSDCHIEEIHRIIDQVHETLSVQYKQFKEAICEHSKKTMSVVETKKTMDQKLEDYLNVLSTEIIKYEEYNKASYDDVESNLKEIADVLKEQMENYKDLFEVNNKSIEEVQEVSKHYTHIRYNEIDQYLKSSSAFKSQEDKFYQNAQHELELIANATIQDCQKFENSLKNSKLLSSNFKSSFNKQEKEENMCFNKIDDVSERVSEICASVTNTCEDLCSSTEKVHTTLRCELKETSMKLLKMQANLHEHDSLVINKFCQQELQYPYHTGDTPRRSQKLHLAISAEFENRNE